MGATSPAPLPSPRLPMETGASALTDHLGVQSNKSHNKKLLSDVAMGAFRCDNRSSLRTCAEGLSYYPIQKAY